MNTDWKAKWIWHPEREKGKNDFVYFRQTFPVEREIASAHLSITADREYCCAIDGHIVGRGPVLGDPRFKRYDSYEITSSLRNTDREHVIAVTVYHDESLPMYPYAETRGLLFQLAINYSDGRKEMVCSDEDTKVYRTQAYSVGNRFNDSYWPEYFNANKDATGWELPEFDDASWQQAVPMIGGGNSLWGNVRPKHRFFPWVNVVPRDIPHPVRTFRYPTVVGYGEVMQKMEASAEDTAIRMSLEPMEPLSKASIRDIACLEQEAGVTTIMNSEPFESFDCFDGIRNATIILDFGQLLNGRLALELETDTPMKIDIGYAADLQDNRIVPYLSSRTQNADQYAARAGKQAWMSFNWRHFRYVQLTFRDVYAPVSITRVRVEEQSYPYNRSGHFESDVDPFNRIYQAADKTIRLCTADRFMDNPSRECRQYSGDCSSVLPALWTLFGNDPIVVKYFRQFQEAQHRTGLYRYSAPGHDNDGGSLFDHALMLLFRLAEYYDYTGDGNLVEEMWGGVLECLKLTETCLNARGLLENMPYDVWMDWAFIHREGEILTVNVLYAEVLRRLARVGRSLGLYGAFDDWNAKAQNITRLIREQFYDPDRGVFVDCMVEGRQSKNTSEHSNALAILYAEATEVQKKSVLDRYLSHNNEFGKGSPAWMFWAYAMVEAGNPEMAMDWMKSRFGALVEHGLDTLPEVWSLYGEQTKGYWRCRNSRASVQIAGVWVAHFFINQIAGVAPAEPGFAKISFKPRFGSLVHCRASVPVPDGQIVVEYEKTRQGELKFQLILPSERAISVDLGIRTPGAVWINEKEMTHEEGLIELENVKQLTIKVIP
ncbi:family 78 glycoside hydrolase catalytic domain [Paenibacillus koleovorans]|uniref:family 78 glycoside hydrolase catalytic domain n=1 Tax=Paenibacillus koleovorans TaxID=121608 RepID=UPI0013E31CC8|nr:family 78 glycoside hydrolase catalytic domain [Paenibacillus koleovorans]